MATSGRMKCLAALAFGKLQLKPADKEQLVEQVVPGKRSFRELTDKEADRVIDELKRRAGQVPTPPQARFGRRLTTKHDVTPLITPAQRERIMEVTRELLASGLTPNYLAGVRERSCGVPFPRTSTEAERVIEAFKAVKLRQAADLKAGQTT